MANNLARPENGRIIAGVCRGMAQRYGISTGLVRLGFLIFAFVGIGEVAYLALWLLMPKAPV